MRERIAHDKWEIQCDNPPYNTVRVSSLIDDPIDLRKPIEDEDERRRQEDREDSKEGIQVTIINQLPESNSQEQEIKELLSQLLNAISNETSLKDEDKSDALEDVKDLVETTQNPDEGKKKIEKAIRGLKRIFTSLPTVTETAIEVVQNFDKLLEAISKLLLGSGG